VTAADTDLNPRRSGAAAPGAMIGGVATILRLEAAVEQVLAILLYRALGGSWRLFAVLFFVPENLQ
jgi:hypothetical protein